jgi:hypothetical protein
MPGGKSEQCDFLGLGVPQSTARAKVHVNRILGHLPNFALAQKWQLQSAAR